MSRKIQIRTSLRVNSDGAEECIRHAFDGVWRVQDGRQLISHDEAENRGRTHILLADGAVEIRRTGAFGSRMVFAEGSETHTKYDTPHGRIDMSVVTHDIYRRHTDAAGMLRIGYSLRMAGSHVSENVLEIEWNTAD